MIFDSYNSYSSLWMYYCTRKDMRYCSICCAFKFFALYYCHKGWECVTLTFIFNLISQGDPPRPHRIIFLIECNCLFLFESTFLEWKYSIYLELMERALYSVSKNKIDSIRTSQHSFIEVKLKIPNCFHDGLPSSRYSRLGFARRLWKWKTRGGLMITTPVNQRAWQLLTFLYMIFTHFGSSYVCDRLLKIRDRLLIPRADLVFMKHPWH